MTLLCSPFLGSGKLRIFGEGENRISFCHVDNYCHGLLCGYEALYPGSPALGIISQYIHDKMDLEWCWIYLLLYREVLYRY